MGPSRRSGSLAVSPRLRRLRAAARPRPPAPLGSRGPPLDARRRARDAARPDARARRAGLVEALRGRGVAVAGARGHARAAVAARRRLARARPQPRRGDGGARVRPPGRDAGARPAVGRARVARAGRLQSLSSSRECCGSSVASQPLTFAYPERGAGAAGRVARARAGRGRRSCSGRPARASRRSCARSPGSCRTSTAAASRAGSRLRPRHAPHAAGRPRRHGRDRVPGPGGPGRLRPRRGRGRVRARERRHAAGRDRLPRARAALAAVGAEHLVGRRRRRALRRRAAARLPRLGARARAGAAAPRRADVPARSATPRTRSFELRARPRRGRRPRPSSGRRAPLALADRVLFFEDGRIVLDAARDEAVAWLARNRPAWLDRNPAPASPARRAEVVRGSRTCRSRTGRPAGARWTPSLELSARRGRRAGRAEREREDDAGEGRRGAARAAAAVVSSATAARATSPRTRAATSSREPRRRGGRARLAAISPRAAAALAAVGLAGFEARHPRDLSSGERERLALATVLVTEPDLLVLDEPTRGVDPERKARARRAAPRAGGRHARRSSSPTIVVFAAEPSPTARSRSREEPVYA